MYRKSDQTQLLLLYDNGDHAGSNVSSPPTSPPKENTEWLIRRESTSVDGKAADKASISIM